MNEIKIDVQIIARALPCKPPKTTEEEFALEQLQCNVNALVMQMSKPLEDFITQQLVDLWKKEISNFDALSQYLKQLADI